MREKLICIHQTSSLDEHIVKKTRLSDEGIIYEVKIGNGESAGDVLAKLFVYKQPAMGFNGERNQVYSIYVSKNEMEMKGSQIQRAIESSSI